MASDAEKKQQPEKEAKPVKVAEKPVKAFEATYTVEELLAASAAEFKTNRVVVRAALTKAGKKSYTMREAKQLIERMKNKEVKA